MAEENGERKAFATPQRSDEVENGFHKYHKPSKRRCCVLCGGCTVMVLAVIAAVILVLALTVYKVRGPEMKLNSITILPQSTTRDEADTTIVVDASVKNQNPVSYYFDETTTLFHYKGVVLGEADGPSGKVGAHRTYRSNVTMSVHTDQVMNMVLDGGLDSDTVPIDSATKVGGHVKILGLVRHHVDVGLNCTVTVAVVNFTVVEQRCRQHMSI